MGTLGVASLQCVIWCNKVHKICTVVFFSEDFVFNVVVVDIASFHIIYFPISFRCLTGTHDDVIKWKHFPRNWPFVWGIHRSQANSPHKGQWRGGLVFSLICVWINGRVNNREAGNLRLNRAHYDVTVMWAIVQLPQSSYVTTNIGQINQHLTTAKHKARTEYIFHGI